MSIDTTPFVSIFVLTYNAERYIVETLESLLAQDYQNYEICISDDASVDGTATILEEYQKKYSSKIKLFLQPKNLGITANCNFLLTKVTGEYVCFVGGDDLLEPNCLSRAVGVALESDASIVFHLHWIIDINSKRLSKTENFQRKHIGTLHDFVKHGVYTLVNGMLVRAEHLPPNGFDAAMPYASDFDFVLQTLKGGRHFCALPEYLSSYRKHERSITATRAYECNLDMIKAYEKLYDSTEVNRKSVEVTVSNLQRAVRKYDIADRYSYWLRKSISTNKRNFKSLLALSVWLVTFGGVRL